MEPEPTFTVVDLYTIYIWNSLNKKFESDISSTLDGDVRNWVTLVDRNPKMYKLTRRKILYLTEEEEYVPE